MDALFEQVLKRPYSMLPLEHETMRKVWRGLSSFIQASLMSGKGISIAGIGTWSLRVEQRDLGNFSKTLRTPAFLINQKFCQNYGVTYSPPVGGIMGGAPVVSLNFQLIAQTVGCSRDTVFSVVKDVMAYCGSAVRNGQQVLLHFPHVGTLTIHPRKTKFQFEGQFAETFESEGLGQYRSPLTTARAYPHRGVSRPQTAAAGASAIRQMVAEGFAAAPAGGSRPSTAGHSDAFPPPDRRSTVVRQPTPPVRPKSSESARPQSHGGELSLQGSSLVGKAKVSADMAAFFDMQLEQKKQRALLEQKMDNVLIEFNKEKAKEHEIEESKKKEAKLSMRKSIDEFNFHMLQQGKHGKLPASQECGNLFAHRVEKGSTGNVSHDEVRDALLKQIQTKDQLKIAQKQRDANFESMAIQQAIREQQIYESQLKESKVAKQMQAREIFMRQMAERRGQALPAALPSEFDMLPGKSENDAKIERRRKAQQLLEEVSLRLHPSSCLIVRLTLQQQMVLIEIRNQQLARQRDHEAAWSLEQAKQSIAIDQQEKREKELRLRSLKEQNRQEWLQQMKDKQNRVLSEKQDSEFGSIFDN
jgi:nucleoid DNA-binding protein